MSLLEEAAAIRVRKGPACAIALLKITNPAIGDELDEALASPLITSTALQVALERRGFKLSDYTIARHRRGACQCL
ncbi:MAG: hypothetical protein ACO3PB_08375 [Miltoncostaeaceae bacterium]